MERESVGGYAVYESIRRVRKIARVHVYIYVRERERAY